MPVVASNFTSQYPTSSLAKKISPLSILFHLSSEAVMVSVVIVIVVANVIIFGPLAKAQTITGQESLAERFVAQHQEINQTLYAKQKTIVTESTPDLTLASTASAAEATEPPVVAKAPTTLNETLSAAITEDTIKKPQVDTISQLAEKQVIVHQVQSGETLSTIAQKYSLSLDTIKWANNLSNDEVQPGWQLKILPVNGVLYEIDSNDTLPDVADYFKGNMDRIVAYNGLSSPEAIEPGQIIICPDCQVPPPPAPEPEPQPEPTPAPAPNPVRVNRPASQPAAIGVIAKAPNTRVRANPRFPYGQCTYYVSTRVVVTWGGNAGRWLANARAAGKATGSTPQAGAIVVTNESPYGHVAFIESYNGSSITISEMNYKGVGITSTRTLPVSSSKIKGYIYP